MKSIWTIGHSTRNLDEFISLLKQNQIKILADVRSFPGSRRFPHFNQHAFSDSLKSSGIAYHHFKDLGGRRKALADSKNSAWRSKAFQGYADYMESEEFLLSAEDLQTLAKNENTAIMCSEAVWWKCHRSLISDYLKNKGWKVLHILSDKKIEEHPFTKPAKIVQGNLFYGED